MYELVKDKPEEKKEEFKRKVGNTAKSLVRGAIKITVRTASGGMMDGSIVDSAEKDISKLLAEQVDGIISDKLQSAAKDKIAISKFREYLEDLSAKEGRPLVFIIDELDRCRPDFALDFVEQIKHLFSVPGITFLLVLNRLQLQQSIKSRYGNEVEAALYLQKFVNLWLSLPRKSNQHQDDGINYIHHALDLMLDEGEKIANVDAISLLSELTKYFKPSFREIEQILSYFSLINNMVVSSSYHPPYQTMIAFICYLKASRPELIYIIENENIDGERFMQDAGLLSTHSMGENTFPHIKYLNKLVVFDWATEKERKRMMEENYMNVSGGADYAPKNLMKKVCGWLSNIHMN